MTNEINYKETVNLPKTDFPIRAGLAQKEPEILLKWNALKLDQLIIDAAKTATQTFTLHDGPPYPNGDIHMGHALNKILKDITTRYYHANGYGTHYIPGWDCHGLPIETQVLKSLKESNQSEKKADIPWFRDQCKTFALKHVDTQKSDFKRLGISADWANPYLTLNPTYESAVIRKFGELAENGLIHKGRKPIHWCMHCETALAEAEIEYADHKSPSVYVAFKVHISSDHLADVLGEDMSVSLLVWTTTPWTLPANVAVAAHPDFDYAIIKSKGEFLITVSERAQSLIDLLAIQDATVIGHIRGQDLVGCELKHPFINRTVPIVNANYVTKEDGTGFVHIAPGHGQDDYIVGQKNDLPILMPVDDKGCFTDEVEWVGVGVFEANKLIGQRMESNGTLRKLQFITHSYPHCWRCKSPVIFRATEQWFVSMDIPCLSDGQTLREKALDAVRTTQWIPSWGQKRIEPMILNRPDWCISRQRSWGIPIPVFNCTDCGHSEMTGIFNKLIVDLVQKKGSGAWFSTPASEILPDHVLCSQCGNQKFEKETDILDVWFESGASFASVIEKNGSSVTFPADLYLEGSDQHRGWFQSSLLIGVGTTGQAPFKSVLTHGFIVDNKGKKMSKSLGNVISPQEVIADHGADGLRWWVASSDFKNDVGVSKDILNQAKDSFSKVRNTIRFCLSNLYDFDATTDQVPADQLSEVDRWALSKLNHLITKVHEYYKTYEFHLVTYAIHDFCAVTLSALYLDMVKDRLYCDDATSIGRRSTQTALTQIVSALIGLIAPILVFTSEDAYAHFNTPTKKPSIHLAPFPTPTIHKDDAELNAKWKHLLDIKDLAYQQLEVLRNQKVIRSFLEAKVSIQLPEHLLPFKDSTDWASLLIVSQVEITTGSELTISVTPAEGQKCVRCWKTLQITTPLCTRCHDAVTARS